MTDEQALDAYLDLHPGDMQARRELSDLYEEQGRDAEAEGMRWLISVGKWPTFSPHYYEAFPKSPWMWWGIPGEGWDTLPDHPHAEVPGGFIRYAYDNGRYATRREAEVAYIVYARTCGLIAKAVPA